MLVGPDTVLHRDMPVVVAERVRSGQLLIRAAAVTEALVQLLQFLDHL